MKVCVGDVYDWIESFAPFENALSFDNVGLLVGSRTQQTDKVMMALDITPDVVKEAAAWGAGLIVSHHPVIFHPLKQVAKESAVYQLARHGMAAVCAHTNLDFAPSFGVNTELARALGLSNTRWVLPCEQVMEALMGELPRTFSALELAEKVKNDLHAESVRVVDGGKPIRQVAVCSGAGGRLFRRCTAVGGRCAGDRGKPAPSTAASKGHGHDPDYSRPFCHGNHRAAGLERENGTAVPGTLRAHRRSQPGTGMPGVNRRQKGKERREYDGS